MTRSPTVLVLNGPNLNMLGRREKEIYGSRSLADIKASCERAAAASGLVLDFRQSNSEGELVGWIQAAVGRVAAVVINGGAYSHTSVAIHDALKLLDVPVIEVHLSNVYHRETFRHHSYISSVARGVICGFGDHSYVLAIEAAALLISA